MKSIKYLLTGLFFGILMVKSEAVSWYRIQEMFRFQSFHMYGIIGTAVLTGALALWLIKRRQGKDIHGRAIVFQDKARSYTRYVAGGSIFGLGWALTGACPGALFVNLGYGYAGMALVLAGALAGTFLYGLLRARLPH